MDSKLSEDSATSACMALIFALINPSSPPPPLLNVVECNLLLTLPTTSFRDIQH